MKIKIVSDSSSNIMFLNDVDYTPVPLTIITDKKQYVDDETLDVHQMVKELKEYKGKSSTSCPNITDWLNSFGDADEIYAVTITSNLSGSYNSAMQARQIYLEKHPNAKVYVFDTLSTGPEMELLIEKIAELIKMGKEFERVVELAKQYLSKTKMATVSDSHFIISFLKFFAELFYKKATVPPLISRAWGEMLLLRTDLRGGSSRRECRG